MHPRSICADMNSICIALRCFSFLNAPRGDLCRCNFYLLHCTQSFILWTHPRLRICADLMSTCRHQFDPCWTHFYLQHFEMSHLWMHFALICPDFISTCHTLFEPHAGFMFWHRAQAGPYHRGLALIKIECKPECTTGGSRKNLSELGSLGRVVGRLINVTFTPEPMLLRGRSVRLPFISSGARMEQRNPRRR